MSDVYSPLEAAKLNNLSPKIMAIKHGQPLPTLREWLFHRNTNGLNKAVCKIGRKVLINEYEFLKWIESHREAK